MTEAFRSPEIYLNLSDGILLYPDENCTIKLLNDSNHDKVAELIHYINPWTGERICEVEN